MVPESVTVKLTLDPYLVERLEKDESLGPDRLATRILTVLRLRYAEK